MLYYKSRRCRKRNLTVSLPKIIDDKKPLCSAGTRVSRQGIARKDWSPALSAFEECCFRTPGMMLGGMAYPTFLFVSLAQMVERLLEQ